ncbi:hypothetical protein ABIA14_006252 [Sinorhizobium fredii]
MTAKLDPFAAAPLPHEELDEHIDRRRVEP